MIIATASNKAAENISDELPAKNSIDGYLAEMEERNHYAAVAAATAESRKADAAWGLVAASLGAKKKRDDFAKAFWWNKERTLYATVAAEISKTIIFWNNAWKCVGASPSQSRSIARTLRRARRPNKHAEHPKRGSHQSNARSNIPASKTLSRSIRPNTRERGLSKAFSRLSAPCSRFFSGCPQDSEIIVR
jgi:hypothetical protein